MLKRSANQMQVFTDLPYANLGQLSNLIPPAKVSEIEISGWEMISLPAIPTDKVSFTHRVGFDVNGLFSNTTELKIGEQIVLNDWTRAFQSIEPRDWKIRKAHFNLSPQPNIGVAFNLGGYSFEGSPTPDETKSSQETYNDLTKLASLISSILQRIFIVSPQRGLTDPFYGLQPSPTEEYSPRQGTQVMGSSLATNLEYNRLNIAQISDWEREILGVGVSTKLQPGPVIYVKNPERGTDFVNEGFGSNQLLFVLERIANTPDYSIVGIEEPEIHLHPKAQFNFGKWLAKTLPFLRKQVIITTHSSDIIAGILAGVHQKTIKPEYVSLLFFEQKDKKIEASISEIDQDGKVTGPALRSFVESAAAQLSEYTR